MLTGMTFLYDATVSGAVNMVKHVTVADEDTIVTTDMVSDWLTGICAHVAIRLGLLDALSATELSSVSAAARRIVERFVAADILDTAYQPDKDEEPAGAAFRATATAELDALVASVDLLRANTGADDVNYGVVVEFPLPRVTMDMRF